MYPSLKSKPDIKNLLPDLSILKKLLTIETIIEFPKLSLMVYEAIKPYIWIFDNQFISFV